MVYLAYPRVASAAENDASGALLLLFSTEILRKQYQKRNVN